MLLNIDLRAIISVLVEHKGQYTDQPITRLAPYVPGHDRSRFENPKKVLSAASVTPQVVEMRDSASKVKTLFPDSNMTLKFAVFPHPQRKRA